MYLEPWGENLQEGARDEADEGCMESHCSLQQI